jgi:hypothetical protein
MLPINNNSTSSIAGKLIFTFSISLKYEQSLIGVSQHTTVATQAQFSANYLLLFIGKKKR